MLGACEGLVEKHQSDGTRYNTAAKREAELVRMRQSDEFCCDFLLDRLGSDGDAGCWN
jgi:hypothetical protein